MVRLTDRPDMTLDVYRGRKTTIQPTKKSFGCISARVLMCNKYSYHVSWLTHCFGLYSPRGVICPMTVPVSENKVKFSSEKNKYFHPYQQMSRFESNDRICVLESDSGKQDISIPLNVLKKYLEQCSRKNVCIIPAQFIFICRRMNQLARLRAHIYIRSVAHGRQKLAAKNYAW